MSESSHVERFLMLMPWLQALGSKAMIFSYEGEVESCGISYPHPPHKIKYRIYRYYYHSPHHIDYETGDVYCLGVEGPVEVNGKKSYLKIVSFRIKPYRHENPDAHVGLYYFVPLD